MTMTIPKETRTSLYDKIRSNQFANSDSKEIQKARMYITELFTPENATLCAGKSKIYGNAIKARSIISKRGGITKDEKSYVADFVKDMGMYNRVSQDFEERSELIELHKTVDKLYGQLKEQDLNDNRTGARRGFNTARKRKLENGGMIAPYHFGGLTVSLDYIAERGLNFDDKISKNLESMESNYWNLLKAVESEK